MSISAPLNTPVEAWRWQPGKEFEFNISSFGWEDGNPNDIETEHVSVTIWAPISGSSATALVKDCDTPQELWDYVREVIRDPLAALKKYHDYEPPASMKPIKELPTNLNDLFK